MPNDPVGTVNVPLRAAPSDPMWPHRTLDVRGLYDSGWRPRPFRDFVLKVHQKCNLACDYCYVYTMPDRTWRGRPMVMSPDVWQAAGEAIGNHIRAHDLSAVRVILHGGEPLLAGEERLAALVGDVRAVMPDGCRVEFAVQTNGVLLSRAMLETLRRHSVRIGVSLDGAAGDNDRHRRLANGRGSFAAVEKALSLLGEPRYESLFAGLLCTIDPRTDPIACFETLVGFQPPAVDFLLPHANWEHPPPGRADGETPYADWLIAVFDRWCSSTSSPVRVRLFEQIIGLLLGGRSRTEQVGLSPVAVVVIETDGAIEQVDSLKSTYEGACATGLNVRTDSLDTALSHPGVVARQLGVEALSDTCRACSVHKVCGAGHYVHRYRPRDGFRNPSVYCADLLRLIRHIRDRTAEALARLERQPE